MLVQPKIETTSLFESIPNAHVFYLFQEIDAYIDHAAAYILTSIQLGKRTLVIENERFRRLIEARLQPLLSASQMNDILFQNNFEFFSIIFNPKDPSQHHFFNEKHKEHIYHYAERIWSHIEWNKQTGFSAQLEEFERKADALLKEAGISCVCAYDQESLTGLQKQALFLFHDFKLTDQGELIRFPA
ncbi:MEDS domain-containing protein [Domibacillus indicus]|uniref:MEDS domain-containing protein n=1 Tax=Domibacillus indicus TaxID=1437523 RepID=UPI0020410FC2|nr:MEDS domain-containing protein [Domibacillus indicus]MCM3789782.1 MEDS domain-containing protein [Domibacillus indicus]